MFPLLLDLQTPGPGTYAMPDPNHYKCRKPIYSMNGRNFIPGDSTKKPGPGTYSPEKVHHKFKYIIINQEILITP